jgi:hypothetical protein
LHHDDRESDHDADHKHHHGELRQPDRDRLFDQ